MTPGSSALAHARSLLPPSFSPSRLTPGQLLAIGGGLGCSAWSYAGMYPQFDEGELRIVLALSSLVFGAIVSVLSSRAPTRAGAFARALGFSALLGVVSSVVPLLFLGGMPFGLFFGVICGIPTGLVYGVPLGILAAMAHRGARAGSSDAADRVAKAAGLWLAAMALVALPFTIVVDFHRHAYDIYETSADAPVTTLLALPAMFAVAIAIVGVTVVVQATLRLRARRRFVARVAAGEEPMYRVRTVDEAPPDVLRIGAGNRVVEWVPDGAVPNAYRAMAQGIPVATLED